MTFEEDIFINNINRWTKLHYYIPNDYDNDNQRYPVIYMYDGHNLFNDSYATYGKSWGMAKFLDNYDKKFIVVGIECDHKDNNRLHEYFPYDMNTIFGYLHGKGKLLMDWVKNDLKPYIDNKFRTLTDRLNTMIAGSSMGGLMSLWSLIQYNDIFSKAAALSPSVRICMDNILDDIRKSNISSDSRLFLDFGDKEIKSVKYANDIFKKIEDEFHKKNAKTLSRIGKGKHQEAFWEKEIPFFMEFLWDMHSTNHIE